MTSPPPARGGRGAPGAPPARARGRPPHHRSRAEAAVARGAGRRVRSGRAAPPRGRTGCRPTARPAARPLNRGARRRQRRRRELAHRCCASGTSWSSSKRWRYRRRARSVRSQAACSCSVRNENRRATLSSVAGNSSSISASVASSAHWRSSRTRHSGRSRASAQTSGARVERLLLHAVAASSPRRSAPATLERQPEQRGEERVRLVRLVTERSGKPGPELEPDARLGIGNAEAEPVAQQLAEGQYGISCA